MDTRLLLCLVAGTSSLAVLVRSLSQRPRAKDWLLPAALTLIAAIAGGLSSAPWAGYPAATLWGISILAPMLGSAALGRALSRQAYGVALRIANVLFVLHPSRAYRAQHQRVLATRALAHDDLPAARAAFEHYARLGQVGALEAALEQARMSEDRETIAVALDALRGATTRPPAVLLLAEMRALAEIGEREACFDLYHRHQTQLERPAAAALRTHVYLLLFAEGGDEAGTRAILGGRLDVTSREIQQLWLGIARFRASRDREGLTRLASSRDGLVRRAARMRLLGPELTAPLRQRDAALLSELGHRVAVEDRFSFGSTRRSPAVATFAIAGFLLLVFAFEVALGGSTDEAVLLRMGALSGNAVAFDHEFWRLFGFLFLHYGPLHFVFNVLGLLVLGPFVERSVGRLAFGGIYLASGLIGGALMVARIHWGYAGDTLLVGASGSIMGLAGATTAVLLLGAVREGALLARQRLIFLAAILALQTVFDLLIPEVSLFAHLVGAVSGFSLTLGYLFATSSRRPKLLETAP